MERSPGATCVFCGRLIGPDELMAGRAPMAAHSACADAALADDSHWDAVAGGSIGADEEDSKAPDAATERRSAGCLAIAAIVAVVSIAITLVGCAPQAPATPSTATSAVSSHAASNSAAPASLEPHVTPLPDAPDSDVVLHLIAEHVRWDVDELDAPAGMTWRLELENRDGPPEIHNFAIVNGATVADRIFMTSPNLQGPATETYEIPGLPAGTYEFVCTLHPDGMRGVLIVR